VRLSGGLLATRSGGEASRGGLYERKGVVDCKNRKRAPVHGSLGVPDVRLPASGPVVRVGPEGTWNDAREMWLVEAKEEVK
jgi:hypothetical protein